MNTLLTNQKCTNALKKGTVSLVFLLSVLLLLAASSLFAQETIALVNASFEEPGAEERNWANIPGWSLDADAIDSGVSVENPLATDGLGTAWLDSDDGALWQLTDYTIQDGDLITLKADVRNSWQTTVFDLILYYDDGGTRVPVATTTGDFEGFVDDFLTEFTVTFLAASAPAAVGKKLGVAIHNTSIPNSFIEVDNFRLTQTTASQESIALVNASFEEPGAEERNWANIPGWSLDADAIDSGVSVENPLATDGLGMAWLDSDDGALWQLTDYTIQDGDIITLMADVRNSWQTTVFDLILYYDDGGARVPVATTTGDFEGFVDDFLTEFAVTFSAASAPEAVGKKLGVAIHNTSIPNSFIEIDNVRLTKVAGGTSVEEAGNLPGSFVLEQNYPNPFNPETTINYQVTNNTLVQISIYNMMGQRVKTLVNEHKLQGVYTVRWNGKDSHGNDVPSGVYLIKALSGSIRREGKMMLVR
ncbi:T9SS type A sorting domain-containing protein [bacterium]